MAQAQVQAVASAVPKIRLHLLGLPHTISRSEFSHCAFTGKVLRFSPMMQSLSGTGGPAYEVAGTGGPAYEVYHYGVATAESGAAQQIDLLTVAEWQALRLESYHELHPHFSREACAAILADKRTFVGDLGNVGTPLYREFNRRLRLELPKHYRSTATDIVCLPFGFAHQEALEYAGAPAYVQVETGIGYVGSYRPYRIFESHAILHQTMQKDEKAVQYYWFVAPNYYNLLEWPLRAPAEEGEEEPSKPIVGYFGRLSTLKGCQLIRDIAPHFPGVDFVLCGQGPAADIATFCAGMPNVRYQAPLEGAERAGFLNSLTALLAPSMYVEPFCGVNVEAQLCGTPVITHEFGAFVETVEPLKTGLWCHTLQDFCQGIRLAVTGHFDRAYIRSRAQRLYDMYQVAHTYDYIFRTILDVHNGRNGWYAPTSHIAKRYLNQLPFLETNNVEGIKQQDTERPTQDEAESR